jgi:hypothetical protein
MNIEKRSICIEICDRIIDFYGYDSDLSLFPELWKSAVWIGETSGLLFWESVAATYEI